MTENLLFIFDRELKRANYTQDYEYYSTVCVCFAVEKEWSEY